MPSSTTRTLFVASLLAIAALSACTSVQDTAEDTTSTSRQSPEGTTTTTVNYSSTIPDPSSDWPDARRSHGLVTLADGTVLLFGGRTNTGNARTYLADTWELEDRDSWKKTAAGTPTPRGQFAFAPLPDGSAVLVGGYVGDRFTYPGTWRYLLKTWVRLETTNEPSARAGSVAAFDAESNVLVMFGGAERPTVAELPTNETWLLNLEDSSWLEVSPEVSPRPKSEGHPTLFELAMVYDSESDRVILLIGGDETWAYDANTNTWEELSPPGLEADFMVAAAYDPIADRVVTHGGAPSELSTETWLFDYNTDSWAQVETVSTPGPVGDHAITYDAVNNVTLLFGGAADLIPLDGLGDVSDKLWQFDGSDWTEVSPASP
ncbi:MAG: Kelch repeat-containing protein [Acidimicrobiia bacterium]